MGKPWRMFTVMVVNEKGPWRSVWGIGARGLNRSGGACADTELPNYGLKKLATG